jgi:uncharacterized protein YwgA
MGSAQESLSPREAVLLALDAAEGPIEGRTAMQKVMYFIANALKTDLGHQAHYYGPYSRPIEYTLSQEVLANDVSEIVERLPSWYSTGPDIRKYTYELTEQGKEEATEIKRNHAGAAEIIATTMSGVKDAVPELDQESLSAAAKIHFIVSHAESHKTNVAEIPNLARELGWRLSERKVGEAVDLLKKLDLVSVS